MISDNPHALFSIYRLDFERIQEIFSIDFSSSNFTVEVMHAVINIISKNVRGRPHSDEIRVKYKGFHGIFLKTINAPEWKDIALQIIKNNEQSKAEKPDDFLTNVNVSYILLRECNKKIYALTGGFGSKYIANFIDKNFGMYLIPKLFKKDSLVLKQVLQNNLLGNQLYSRHANRNNTNFLNEQETNAIYRQLDIEADKEIGEILGIKYKEGESSQKLHIINKDSIIIRRRFSLDELIDVLNKIDKLDELDDNFPLNYLVLAKKRGISNLDAFNSLILSFVNHNISSFTIVGDEYSNYIINSARYIVRDENNAIIIDQSEPISLCHIIENASAQRQLSATYLKTVLKKWTINTEDTDGRWVIPPLKLFDAMQGFVEIGEKSEPVYLFNGSWYVFDAKYAKSLQDEYCHTFDAQIDKRIALLSKFFLSYSAKNEKEYIEKLESVPGICVTHKNNICNVEIADAIFWDDSTVYLLHIKGRFNGEGTRDVTNQIITSSEYLQRELIRGAYSSELNKYYDTIAKNRSQIQEHVSKEEFIDIMTKRKICYIAGYIEGFSRNTTSTYAKYLTIETMKKLSQKDYDFIALGLTSRA